MYLWMCYCRCYLCIFKMSTLIALGKKQFLSESDLIVISRFLSIICRFSTSSFCLRLFSLSNPTRIKASRAASMSSKVGRQNSQIYWKFFQVFLDFSSETWRSAALCPKGGLHRNDGTWGSDSLINNLLIKQNDDLNCCKNPLIWSKSLDLI